VFSQINADMLADAVRPIESVSGIGVGLRFFLVLYIIYAVRRVCGYHVFERFRL
jgi:hypothetical protein